ncbi:type I polyketide synthase [Vibrio crassostreae]|uniref:type I polyketide synthase n=1 Tax=Vibrio crassostreae TaxID=246167 RepID=UPI00062F4663|nr:type I polyketide synthase [Vibrio crassostreae]TCT56966.1 polyketide-type polyunsaturated fatty acid synthase PfaA [Vibrio crassostreae]TCT69331.1 polyketide-type polyunsaturated fatty acid synthase PfaA [Vibrio crassostreae]TCT80591.1 polyketide-type polyunsaturated fatty acid synthase PfaA [Vibrio crassostreae]TCT99210.1 polyketide-type polyunsaturated fatty acid synthase PfaA [Vibrio crassostreae]CAK1802830.1 Type I polyketide synthase [Vibrio crassostreae]
MSQPEKNTPESVDDTRLNKRLKDMPIAIVGMASMFANSRYLNKFWDLISEKIDAITEVPDTHWRPEDYYDSDRTTPDKSYCKRGGFIPEVDFNPMEFGLPPNILELTDTSQLLSLIVAKEVLEDAKLPEGYDRDKIGITLGVGGGQKIAQSLNARLQYPVLKKVFKSSGINDEDSEMLIKKFQDQYIHWEENSFPGSLGNVISGRIANRFDLGGINCVVDAACAGSLAAMRMALSELVEGRSEMMITGGVCTDNSPTMYMSFSKTPAFTTNETIQPFDIDSKGMMIGEGIGMVALKRLEDAERDGDRIYSVIKGVGSSSDGKFKSIYAPRPEGQAKALKRAYDDAGFAPHTLGLLEAHGTGTAAGDVAEFGGLNSVFSENNEEKQHIALGSVKSQIGHTKSTAGTAGLIKAALALHHKVLPPTINVSSPNPKLDIENSPFYLNTQTRPWMQRVDGTPRRAGISSFGFGGTNFHVVLEEYTPEHARGDKYRQRQVPQTLLFSAESRQALIDELKQVSTQAADAAFKLEALAEQHSLREVNDQHARLGLVVTDQADLQAQLTQAISMLESQTKTHWQMPNGTSYRESALIAENGAGKVAALFAGQGSQYLNMGRELACHYPEMRQQLAQADQVFGQHKKTALSQILFPIPTFTPEATKAQEAVLTNTANAQSAIGTVSMGQFDIMTQAGFKADMVAGHSFGELSALCASGVISQEDYYQLAFARGDTMAATPEQGDSGTMFAVILDADKLPAVESCISQFEGVSIANYNAPTQLVIAGPTATVQQAAQALTEQGFKAIALPVSGAFHTPLVAHAQKPFASAIDKASFSAPTLPLYSNATGKLYSKDAKAIKKAFKQHMLQSVRFSEQIEAMYEAGARVFVEFGPKNILQKLVEKTLADKNEELYAISINPSPKGDSDQQLRLAAVQLCVAGVSLDNIDPYQADIAEPAKASPMNIKLNATNYISPATRKKMDQSLASGNVTEKTEIVEVKVEVEKIVEKEVIKTEIVEVPVAAPQASNVQQSTAPAPSAQVATAAPQSQVVQTAPATIQPAAQVTVDESSLQSFFNAQQQAAEVHQQFLAIPQQYGDTFNTLMSEQAKMATAGVAIPENLQRSMEMFHQHQAETLKAHAHYLEMQAHSNNSALNMLTQGSVQTAQPTFVASVNAQPVIQAAPTAIVQEPVAQVQATPVQAAPVQAAPLQKTAAQQAPVQKAVPTPQVAAQAAAPVAAQPVPVKAQPAPVAAPVAVQSADAEKVMLEVVAEKTGYPTEMLDLEMDMEADLGIDSIKRVEILGTVQDEMPNLPELNPEDLAECRTLGEIVTYMNSKMPASAPVAAQPSATAPVQAANGLDAKVVQQTMLEVVAEKTGYPTEMLDLEMDMEADLGIDSIKRVEILGTVQDELPTLPELNPEDLAECRTLGEIVAYMNSKLPASAPVAVQTEVGAPAAANSGLDAAVVQKTMLEVVAEKTGYPTEMLDLAMDMEADLGIDSIKRVEILGTVQDELPTLPELNPEDLAECRTLGEIVDYMNSKLPASAPVAAQTSAPVQAVSNGLNAEQVQGTMLSVVADKTGYPTEMLDLAMDMEADLGIDSIKRVEILGTVQDQLPTLPELNPEDLAECRTLGEIVDYMNSKLGATATTSTEVAAATVESASNDLNPAHVQSTMMEVVADKTGYPAEMLDLAMDMEADLGIDSIKRVEILGTVQDQLPTLPELNPEDLAECRTLGEIVTYMQNKLSAAAPVATPKAESVTPIAETATAELPPHNEVALKKLPAADKLVDCFSKDACVVITDDGHNAGVLSEKLTANGIQVAVVRSALSAASPLNSEIASYTLNSVDDAGVTAVINDIETDLKTSNKVIAGFIHLQAIVDAKQSNEQAVNLNADSRASLTTAFLFAKHLNGQLNAVSGRSVFFTLSRIDGGFGYLDTKQLANAELNQAALSGLTKTLSHEWSNVFCRALDADASIDARHLAEAITGELFDIDTNTVEIGLSHAENGESGRATLIATTPGAAQTKNTGAQLTKSDKVLVTGGAKGVTFECALTLAKQCKSHFILAGRSKHITSAELPQWAQGKQEKELKPAATAHLQATGDKPTPKKVDALLKPVLSSLEINAALAAFNEIGASAEYLSLDVSNHESVAKTLANFDGITGLIHGAGVLADKHIQDKTLDELNMVYGTKVGGLEAVLGGLDSGKLKLIAMFSSAAGFYGNTGQSDYSMSNEILNKAALQLSARNPQAKVMSFNWGPWDGGMVNAALKRMFTERGVYVIPLQAGAELFSSQLLNETGIQLLVGTSMQGSDNKEAAVKKLNAESVHLAESPLNTSITVTRHLDPKALPFIQDHCIAGNPVLPTVCAIQWMREVAEQLLGVNVSVHNYKLLKGVIFDTDEVQELKLVLSSDAKSKDQLKAVISCQGRPQYQAQLQVASVQVSEDVQQASTKRFEASTSTPVTTAQALYSDGTLFHGPRLQGITSVERFDDLGLLAQCQLPQIENSDCGSFIPKQSFGDSQPFAEDYLLQAMLVWARLKYGAASLPSAIGEFVCYAPMHNGDQGWLELNVIKSTARSLQADISLYHQDGHLSAVMKGAKVTISKSLNDAFLPKSSSTVSKKESNKNAEKEQLT